VVCGGHGLRNGRIGQMNPYEKATSILCFAFMVKSNSSLSAQMNQDIVCLLIFST